MAHTVPHESPGRTGGDDDCVMGREEVRGGRRWEEVGVEVVSRWCRGGVEVQSMLT
jgi:hypothetical protein